jgi:hypothetical protein
MGTSFRRELEAEIDPTQLPERVGGQYKTPTVPFEFDCQHENSLLWTPPREMVANSATTPHTNEG